MLRKRRGSGDRWHARWRDAAGVQHEKVLGKVWSGRGRPAEGYLTKALAQTVLDDFLADARRANPRSLELREVSFSDAAK